MRVSLEDCEVTGYVKEDSEGREMVTYQGTQRFEQLGHLWILAMSTSSTSSGSAVLSRLSSGLCLACVLLPTDSILEAWGDSSPLMTRTQLHAWDIEWHVTTYCPITKPRG